MAFDSGHEALSIDEYLVANPARTVLIRVKGDSMIDAGIHSGDTVVAEKRSHANVGDIVVAIIDNEFTLKRLGGWAATRARSSCGRRTKPTPSFVPRATSRSSGWWWGSFGSTDRDP
jgi:hypothetical protein